LKKIDNNQLNYVAELLNWSTCLFRPGYLQTWVQLGGGHGGCGSK